MLIHLLTSLEGLPDALTLLVGYVETLVSDEELITRFLARLDLSLRMVAFSSKTKANR